MPSSTRSNKEQTLLFSDHACLERSIRKKKKCTASINNNTRSSTDTRLPPSTETTLPSTATPHPTSIDIPHRTSIDTELQDMVATIVLIQDATGNLHDKEGHLRNATEEVASYAAVRILSHEEFAAKHPHPPKPLCIKKSDIDWHHGKLPMDRQTQPTIDTTTPASIDDHLLHTECSYQR
ncbi:hypothetical protein DY000_02015881 [Brassica cretica]|uniref:Late embryogenesis abundant protein LEA-2 subgroup domain-containing protein n=1 Tax=Brassica cretica TaxID=69181 RepID=A0ABQ7D8G1_BRACR|nr:hypothetical protein DY000_02015881 [Brassica cretica]